MRSSEEKILFERSPRVANCSARRLKVPKTNRFKSNNKEMNLKRPVLSRLRDTAVPRQRRALGYPPLLPCCTAKRRTAHPRNVVALGDRCCGGPQPPHKHFGVPTGPYGNSLFRSLWKRLTNYMHFELEKVSGPFC